MGEGKGVVISESFQSRFGQGASDTIELTTPSGRIVLRILGVYVDYSSDVGSVLIDRALYKQYWRDELVDAFDLWLEAGADQQAVIANIKEQYGEPYQLFISTHSELRKAVVDIMEQSFVVNYAVEIVAVVVAILSVINTLFRFWIARARSACCAPSARLELKCEGWSFWKPAGWAYWEVWWVYSRARSCRTTMWSTTPRC
jgi:putative ABC transport system permease protein